MLVDLYVFTAMNQTNLDTVLVDLEKFVEGLKEYRRLLGRYKAGQIDPSQKEKLNRQNEYLVREAGRLKPVVSATSGSYKVTRFGMVSDPWADAFSTEYNNPFLEGYIDVVIQNTNAAIGTIQGAGLKQALSEFVSPRNIERPKVLIAHDGESQLRTRLEMECWRLGLDPVVVEEEPSGDESVDVKVSRVLTDCQFGVVLARLERGISQDDQVIPRGNIIDEIERIRTKLGDKYLVLLETGLGLPSNLATGIVFESFSEDNFDKAILSLVRSLRHHQVL